MHLPTVKRFTEGETLSRGMPIVGPFPSSYTLGGAGKDDSPITTFEMLGFSKS